MDMMLSGLEHRVPELGRIRLGEKDQRGLPRRLMTFRLTSGNKKLLEAAAGLYGGKVTEWKDAPDEGFWQLTTQASELDILIPTNLRTVSQAYELWEGGTCMRRCDGTTESISGGPCICDPAARECEPMTRVSVMLPRLPGLGVWRLDTSGYVAATTLPATLQLLTQLSGGSAWVPATLRAEQRSKRVRLPDGKAETHRFVVPVLDLPGVTVGTIVEGMGLQAPQLEAGRPTPAPTAAARVAERRASIEAQTTAGSDDLPVGAQGIDPPADDDAVGPVPVNRAGRPMPGNAPAPGPDHAGGLDASGADEAIPMPAPPDERPARPATCPAFDDDKGRCRREVGHPGHHRNKEQETWA